MSFAQAVLLVLALATVWAVPPASADYPLELPCPANGASVQGIHVTCDLNAGVICTQYFDMPIGCFETDECSTQSFIEPRPRISCGEETCIEYRDQQICVAPFKLDLNPRYLDVGIPDVASLTLRFGIPITNNVGLGACISGANAC